MVLLKPGSPSYAGLISKPWFPGGLSNQSCTSAAGTGNETQVAFVKAANGTVAMEAP